MTLIVRLSNSRYILHDRPTSAGTLFFLIAVISIGVGTLHFLNKTSNGAEAANPHCPDFLKWKSCMDCSNPAASLICSICPANYCPSNLRKCCNDFYRQCCKREECNGNINFTFTPCKKGEGMSCIEEAEPVCNNGMTEKPEQCDDGNTKKCDGCFLCKDEGCGNDRIDNCPGNREKCDDGNSNSNDGCSSTCQCEINRQDSNTDKVEALQKILESGCPAFLEHAQQLGVRFAFGVQLNNCGEYAGWKNGCPQPPEFRFAECADGCNPCYTLVHELQHYKDICVNPDLGKPANCTVEATEISARRAELEFCLRHSDFFSYRSQCGIYAMFLQDECNKNTCLFNNNPGWKARIEQACKFDTLPFPPCPPNALCPLPGSAIWPE